MIFRFSFLTGIYDTITSVNKKLSKRKNNPAATSKEKEANITSYNKIAELPQCGHALFDIEERSSFDLSRTWFRILENRATFPETQARYYTIQDKNTISAIIPITLEHNLSPINRKITGLTNFYTSLYRPLIAPDVATTQLTNCIRTISKDTKADSIRFDAMDVDHPSFTLIESAFKQAGLRPSRFFCFGNWYLPVHGRTYDDYLKSRPSKLSNTIRRKIKKFSANGRGQLKIIDGGNCLNDAIEAWEVIYNNSWKKPEPYPMFMPELIRSCAKNGWLRLGIAYYDSIPIAAQLWIVCHDHAAIYKLAHNADYTTLSPGTVLTAYLMEHAMDVDKVSEVDYLIGDDEYKKEWMTHRRERWGIIAYNQRSARGLIGLTIQNASKLRKQFMNDNKRSASGK